MIKVEVIKKFNLKDFDEIKDSLVRKSIDVKGQLFEGDTFECSKEMADYLLGDNPLNEAVVKVVEVEPIIDAVFVEKESAPIKVVASRKSKNKKK